MIHDLQNTYLVIPSAPMTTCLSNLKISSNGPYSSHYSIYTFLPTPPPPPRSRAKSLFRDFFSCRRIYIAAKYQRASALQLSLASASQIAAHRFGYCNQSVDVTIDCHAREIPRKLSQNLQTLDTVHQP